MDHTHPAISVPGERIIFASLSSPWLVSIGVAAFWMLLIWLIHWDSPRTLVSFHGFIHAAIAERFLDTSRITFPPENPFFAGEPVSYYWFFQFIGAQIARLFGWNIFHALSAMILVATGGLMILAIRLGRILFRSTLAGILIGYLVVAGTNPFGFVFAIWTILSMAVQSPQRLVAAASADTSGYLWNVVHPLYSLIRFNDFGGLYGPLMNFFLNMTSRPVALACLLGMLFCLEYALRTRRTVAFLVLGMTSALTTAFSSIIGIPAGGALIFGMSGSWLMQVREKASSQATLKSKLITYIVASASIIGGLVLAAPTYYHLLLGPSADHLSFTLFASETLLRVITIGLSISVLLFLALLGMRGRSEPQSQFYLILVLGALLPLAANVAFTLPTGNESNFFHAAVVLLVIPAAGSVVRPRPNGTPDGVNRRAAAAIALLFAPTMLLLLAAYIHRPPLPAVFENSLLARMPQDDDLARLYQWVKTRTDPDAILVVDPRARIALTGNTSEIPALTNRVLFTEDVTHYLVAGYADATRRYDIAVRLISGDTLDLSDSLYLASFNRPTFILIYKPVDAALMDRMQSIYDAPVFRYRQATLFRWRNR